MLQKKDIPGSSDKIKKMFKTLGFPTKEFLQVMLNPTRKHHGIGWEIPGFIKGLKENPHEFINLRKFFNNASSEQKR